jgi:hypothetical protein
MNLVGVVTFVHTMEVGRSGSVTLFEEFLGMTPVERIPSPLSIHPNSRDLTPATTIPGAPGKPENGYHRSENLPTSGP